MTKLRPLSACRLAAGISCLLLAPWVHGQTLGTDFSSSYTVNSLGSVPSLPTNYGGLTFLNGNTLLIGGAANGATGSLYTIDVTRNATNHITGFVGTATRYLGAAALIGEYNDGGVLFGPGGVLFTARWPINSLGQTKPGSTNEDKVIELGPLGVASSLSALNFVPAGQGGAGQLKMVSYSGGEWYSGSLSADGSGTFNINGLTQVDLNGAVAGIQNVPGGPEGFVYIASGNPGFAANSMLISEYQAGVVGAYAVDGEGNPLVATRRTFLSGLTGAEGAVIDPLTGDFLFSTFGGTNRVVVVSGFLAPPPTPDPTPTPIPEPETYALMLAGLGLLGAVARRRRR
jgi:hypothetical protein